MIRTLISAPWNFWKHYLKLSLVTCPVAMTPAVRENEKARSGINAIAHPINAHGRKCTPRFQLNELLTADPTR